VQTPTKTKHILVSRSYSLPFWSLASLECHTILGCRISFWW